MKVRPARAADADALYTFACRLALDHAPERDAYDQALRDALADARSLVLVAEAGGRPIGSLVAGLLPMPLYGARLALLQESDSSRVRRCTTGASSRRTRRPQSLDGAAARLIPARTTRDGCAEG